MSKEYYTIIREYYGFPDYINTDLSEKEDCFAFDTEYEANQCLRDIFKNGEWMEDERHGKIRHYVAKNIKTFIKNKHDKDTASAVSFFYLILKV